MPLGIVSDKSRFRSLPMLTRGSREATSNFRYDQEKINDCARVIGHVLRVRENEVFCERCPVVWRDEGF